MLNWPEVTVLICTYDRLRIIERTLLALAKNLVYPRDRLHWLITDDSSPNDYLHHVSGLKICEILKPELLSTPHNMGFGANVNMGQQQVSTDYTLFVEDDKLLEHKLDLRIGVALLETRANIGLVRYRGAGGESFIYHQFETNISDFLPDYQDGVGLSGRLNYLQIDSGSPALYIYSNGPHLKHRSFHAFYGDYPEGLRLGHTEESMAHLVKDKMIEPGAPAIAVLPEFIDMWFTDIGESRQHTELDRAYAETV